MSDTVYLVRLREAFNRADYDDTSATFNAEPNVRMFASRDAAERFAAQSAPHHCPLDAQAVHFVSRRGGSGTFNVDPIPDEMHWEYYVGADGVIGDLSEPPEEALHNNVIPGREIAETALISAINDAGLTPPDALPGGERTVSQWRDWWNASVTSMTETQRVAVWHMFAGSPYLILKMDAELETIAKERA